MLNALEALNPRIPELFVAADYEEAAGENGCGIHPAKLEKTWRQLVNALLTRATLPLLPEAKAATPALSGKQGLHSEHLGYILAEMQFLQRAYPGCCW
jgi:ring-1,2-phenylacetyl-CoA epoxidase subunit PaaC